MHLQPCWCEDQICTQYASSIYFFHLWTTLSSSQCMFIFSEAKHPGLVAQSVMYITYWHVGVQDGFDGRCLVLRIVNTFSVPGDAGWSRGKSRGGMPNIWPNNPKLIILRRSLKTYKKTRINNRPHSANDLHIVTFCCDLLWLAELVESCAQLARVPVIQVLAHAQLSLNKRHCKGKAGENPM